MTKDGRVGASDPRYDLSGWNDIAAVKAYSYSAGLTKHSKSIVGLKNDGTLIVRTFDVSFNPITGRPKAVRWTGDKHPDVRLF